MLIQTPALLGLLVLLPLLIGAYTLAQRRRRRFALRYPSLALLEGIQARVGWRRHIPPLLFFLSLGALVIALARPALIVRVPSDEGIVILTLDISASMWVGDMYPSRMEAAKAAAQTFVEQMPPKMRIGVVSFSENAYLNQAPTTDRVQLVSAIKKLYPRSGTAIGSGLLTSLDAINGALGFDLPVATKDIYAPAVIVLLSDGENSEGPAPLDVIQHAAAHGIRVYTIGIGSPASTTISKNAMAIQARLDEESLKQMALLTGGSYYNAASEQDLRAVYEKLSTQIVMRREARELTFGFLSSALVLGISAVLLSLVWSNRLP